MIEATERYLVLSFFILLVHFQFPCFFTNFLTVVYFESFVVNLSIYYILRGAELPIISLLYGLRVSGLISFGRGMYSSWDEF